jgi:uncharacterized protein YukE
MNVKLMKLLAFLIVIISGHHERHGHGHGHCRNRRDVHHVVPPKWRSPSHRSVPVKRPPPAESSAKEPTPLSLLERIKAEVADTDTANFFPQSTASIRGATKLSEVINPGEYISTYPGWTERKKELANLIAQAREQINAERAPQEPTSESLLALIKAEVADTETANFFPKSVGTIRSATKLSEVISPGEYISTYEGWTERKKELAKLLGLAREKVKAERDAQESTPQSRLLDRIRAEVADPETAKFFPGSASLIRNAMKLSEVIKPAEYISTYQGWTERKKELAKLLVQAREELKANPNA